MGSAQRRQREKESLREKILGTAREMFASEGVEAVSMRKIAGRIEYSATAIYQYFPDKDALLREICERDFAALAEAAVRVAREADPLARLRKLGRAYVEFALEHPSSYRLMFMTPKGASQKASRRATASPSAMRTRCCGRSCSSASTRAVFARARRTRISSLRRSGRGCTGFRRSPSS